MFERVETLQTTLEAISSAEGRLAVSGGVIVLALVIGFVVAPIVVRRTVGYVGRRLRQSEAGSVLETIDEVTDVPFPMRAVIRTLQAGVLGTTGLLLLFIWGRPDLADRALELMTTVFPVFSRPVLTIGLLAGAIIGTRFLERRLDEWLADATYVTAHQEASSSACCR